MRDREQVHVERAAVDRVELDAVEQDRARAPAVDGEVHQGRGTHVAAQQVELVGVERDCLAGHVAAEHDRGQAALAADPGDLLAGHGSGGRIEARSVGH